MVSSTTSIALIVPFGTDYETFQLTLASHSSFSLSSARLFLIQTVFGTYESIKSKQLADLYASLYPDRITVLDVETNGVMENTLKECFNRGVLDDFDLIVFCTERVLAVKVGWIDSLLKCIMEYESGNGSGLAYVSAFVNNNSATLEKVLDKMGLRQEFFDEVSHRHLVGRSPEFSYSPYRVLSENEISSDGYGTLYCCPHISYWLHKKTTLDLPKFLSQCDVEEVLELDSHRLNLADAFICRKRVLQEILNSDCEYDLNVRLQRYCLKKNLKVLISSSSLVINLFYDIQRSVNAGLLKDFKTLVYNITNSPLRYSLLRDEDIFSRERLLFYCYHRKIYASKANSGYEDSIMVRMILLRRIKNLLKEKLNHQGFLYRFLRKIYLQVRG